MNYPASIQNLIDQFTHLPGIGPKTAERLVIHLLKQPRSALVNFGAAIEHIKDKVVVCQTCYNFAEINPCQICADPRRLRTVICVVAKPQDIEALEKTHFYQGLYHVLGGAIDPLDNQTPDQTTLPILLKRVQNEKIEEVIIALNPDVAGETTSLYVKKALDFVNQERQKQNQPAIKLTRLARGLPIGADVEYADQATLENALRDRHGW